jgi:hypothetical protein
MQRRSLLKLGIGSTVVLAAAGAGVALMQPGMTGGRLSAAGRAVFLGVAGAVLDGVLPAQPTQRAAALQAHLTRMDATVAAFPAATQREISQLLALLAFVPGRLGLASLARPWGEASVAEIQHALQGMRTASLAVKQQAYHALRDLTNAAYFSDPSTWAHLGYPGPNVL